MAGPENEPTAIISIHRPLVRDEDIALLDRLVAPNTQSDRHRRVELVKIATLAEVNLHHTGDRLESFRRELLHELPPTAVETRWVALGGLHLSNRRRTTTLNTKDGMLGWEGTVAAEFINSYQAGDPVQPGNPPGFWLGNTMATAQQLSGHRWVLLGPVEAQFDTEVAGTTGIAF